jgi:hypothetical protein
MKSSNAVARLTLGLLAASTIALVGCGSSPEDVSHDAITGDLTPELLTLNQREVDYDDKMAITFNSNWRAMWGDIARGLLIDRPSRLAPLPIAH